jgi:lysophospholipid acyltransferase (LPLAT)-like uncharacterized protein
VEAPSSNTPPVSVQGRVVPQQPTFGARVAARLIQLLVCGLAATLRWRFTDASGVSAGTLQGPVIFATWHNRLALSLIVYRKFVAATAPGRRLAALVSASRDGALLARVLELFEVQPVRGSTSRRGGQSLLELTSAAEQGLDVAITPDGPRGPCYEVQRGVIALAKLTGRPVVPVSYRLGWKVRLKSWDRFQIPLPFSRCEVRFGAAIAVGSTSPEPEQEAARAQLETRLRELTAD